MFPVNKLIIQKPNPKIVQLIDKSPSSPSIQFRALIIATIHNVLIKIKKFSFKTKPKSLRKKVLYNEETVEIFNTETKRLKV